MADLVHRHAPMVWGVCRRVLRDPHDAEDAFQATFLVLVRRAAAIAEPDLVGNWLYGVAHQTARKARSTRARRWARETTGTDLPDTPAAAPAPADDLRAVLDRELSRLPAKYRAAVVLCDLEGRTRAEAARQLGVPPGTVAARVARGRARLAARLARRGVTVPAAALAAVLTRDAAGAPAVLVRELPARVVALADRTTRGLAWAGLKKVSAAALGLGVLAVGIAVFPSAAGTDPPEPTGRPADAPAAVAVADRDRLQGTWRVTASEVDGIKDFDRGRGHDRLVFAGDRVTYWSPKGPQAGRFRLDPTQAPAEIDIEFDGGSVVRGRYDLDGTRLRFVWTKGGRRPAGFDTAAGEWLTFLYTYEKTP
jgi:RNA polymerase sigma factor (sigma-70 family)